MSRPAQTSGRSRASPPVAQAVAEGVEGGVGVVCRGIETGSLPVGFTSPQSTRGRGSIETGLKPYVAR